MPRGIVGAWAPIDLPSQPRGLHPLAGGVGGVALDPADKFEVQPRYRDLDTASSPATTPERMAVQVMWWPWCCEADSYDYGIRRNLI